MDIIRFPENDNPLYDYNLYRYRINELIIDDNMFMYGSRSTKFINLEATASGKGLKSYFTGLANGRDLICSVSLEISGESKVITRTRRKFWDDVSLRGG